jgi:hypothetical protein
LPRTKYVVTPTFAKVRIESADHGSIQRANDSKIGVRLGVHTPNFKIKSMTPEWQMKGKSATALLSVELAFEYSGLIRISKNVPSSSACYKAAEEHELEHESICVSETKASIGACEKILQSHVEAILKKSYKNDIAKAEADESAFIRAVGIAAFSEMQDGPFYKVADKSTKIDTASTYAPIEALCADYLE